MPDPQALQRLLKDFHARVRDKRPSVAVIGDMILDSHIEGAPSGRHPEIGVPILKDGTSQESSGGAANIALALARLGVRVLLFGVVGSDLAGRQLENLLDRQTFVHYLVTERGWPTPHKHWIYQRQDNRLSLLYRIDYDKPLSGRAREQLLGEFRARCPNPVDVVVLADHGLGSIGPESMPLVELARERDAKLVGIPRSTILRGQPLDAIVINGPEMRALDGAEPSADPRALAGHYAETYAQDVFLTMLEEGIFVCPAGSQAGTLIQGYPLTCAHWMGARDMATVIVALGLALDMDPVDNARLANAFRHLVASQRGNGRILWRDVFQFVGLGEEP
jgi:D-beta-D-heptose 7-phosphate kinase / D-beta-D-heptose 1-phosphate adenosyltransferase